MAEHTTSQPLDSAISGIEGWLILPALGLLVAPFATAFWIFLTFRSFGTPMSADSQAVLMIETLVLSGMLLFQIYVAFAFFRQKTTAPYLVIALFIARIFFDAIDPGQVGLTGSLIAAGIWIPYFLWSKRVKATFVFGGAIGNGIARPLANEAFPDLAFVAPSASRRPESDQATGRADPPKERGFSGDERIAALPVAAAASESGAEWRAIRAGKELGPMSRAELVEMAGNGEIDADDLVKQTGGLWTKAREFGFLQQQFALRDSREEARRQAINRHDRFHGIWLSKNALVIVGGVLLVLLVCFAAVIWAISRPTKDAFVRGDKIRKKALIPAAEMQALKPVAEVNDALFYSKRGFAWLDKGDYNNAIKDYTEAIRLDPNNGGAYVNRGFAWSNKKDFDNAIKDYTEAIRLDPAEALSYFNRGFAWSNKKDFDNAIKDYTEAIRLDPNNGGAYVNRGIAWGKKGDYDNAIKDCTEAIRLDPAEALSYFNRGFAWSNKKDFDNAIKDYTEAIRLDPNNGNAHNSRGFAWDKKGDYENAFKDYTEAIRLDPNNGDAYFNRGNAWSNKKEYGKAICDYTDAIRLNPSDAGAYNNRGLAWYCRNDVQNAQHDFDQARRLDPKNFPPTR